MDRTFVIDQIESDLRPLPAVRDACLAIVDYLARDTDALVERVTFGLLTRVAGLSEVEDVLPAVQYLSGARLHLLEPRFEFIDPETGTIEELSAETVRKLRDGTESYHHPDKGEIVQNIEQSLFLFFVPSPQARLLGRTSK